MTIKVKPTKVNPKVQSKQSQKLYALVKAGVIQPGELSTLKTAIRQHQRVGDISRLPRNQRDVLTRYYDTTSNAAMGSNASFNAVKKNINSSYEDLSGADLIAEAAAADMPAMMVLKRKGIRIFPNGNRVALYTNDALGLTFTVPYSASGAQAQMTSMGVFTKEEFSEDAD